MKIWLYTFCWNEAPLVPYFLRHYTPDWVDRIIVYDNESTDESRKLLEAIGRVEIRDMRPDPGGLNRTMARLREEAVQESAGKTPWVFVPDFDEFLYHHDIKHFLNECYNRDQWYVVRPYGWNMVHSYFPRTKGKITDEVRRGYPHYWYSKPILIRPEKIKVMNFSLGAHNAQPHANVTGETVFIRNVGSAKILHYRCLGWPYYWKTVKERSVRHAKYDADWKGSHYDDPYEKQRHDFMIYLRDAVDLTT